MARQVSSDELRPTTYPWEIHAKGLRVRAGRRIAVKNVDLSLGVGVHGLLGPNGAGKTTLMRALATVVRPAAGELELLGRRAAGPANLRSIRARIGYLPQNFGYYRRFTLREFIEYIAWLKEMPKGRIDDAVDRAIDRVGLSDRANDRMKTLSGGMIRRAGIAQAIVNEPDILLLDEPTAGLDPAQRMEFRALLRELVTDACVVVATHLVEDVAAACTDVVVLDEGQLVFHGPTSGLADAGSERDQGDSSLERGYSAVMATHRNS